MAVMPSLLGRRAAVASVLAGCAVAFASAAAAAPAAATSDSSESPARAPVTKPLSAAEVLAASPASDWRALDPKNTLYLELPSGRVVIELAEEFAPRYVANVLKLARAHYFDGLTIERAQDNYVVQWGDPTERKPVAPAERRVPAEFERSARGLNLTPLPDPDTYAPLTGFVNGFPVAEEPRLQRAWLVHCYGMIGAGRDDDVDSGGGTELYAVIGQAPRHLDRNTTLLGRVVQGMELLSVMPRGMGAMGFYEKPQQGTPIRTLTVAADVPPERRSALEVLRTDSVSFAAYLEARRNRRESWFKVPAGRIDVCNLPIPVRPITAAGAPAK